MTSWRTFQGQQVMRHSCGLWNGIWSDMFIKTTFMQYRKRPAWTDWDHTDSLTVRVKSFGRPCAVVDIVTSLAKDI